MLKAGVHQKIVSERLGHSTIAITVDTYSHVLPDMRRDAALALDRLPRDPLSAPKRRERGGVAVMREHWWRVLVIALLVLAPAILAGLVAVLK